MKILADSTDILISPISKFPGDIDDFNPKLSALSSTCHGFWYQILLIVPSVLFVAYLAFNARKNYKKLSHGRSYIIIANYALLCSAAILNLAWCSLQAWECTSGKEVSWNLLSLFTTSVMLSLEISLVAFLLQENYTNGLEALARTFFVSAIIVGLDILLKVIYVFGFGVPMFTDTEVATHRVKWALWTVHKLLLTMAYGFILFMHHSKWREKLPPRPAFHNYIVVMFVMNVVALFACGLAGSRASFGLWLYNFTVICYHSLFLPFLYVTFLSDFFQEEDLLLDNAYYSEMRDAGFFDADWD